MGRYDSKQKRAILEAAEAVFAEKGLKGAAIRLVSQKVGHNSALIYYYFENKTKLFEEVICMVLDDFLAALSGKALFLENAREKITFLVNEIFDYYIQRRLRMRLMLQVFNLHVDILTKAIMRILGQRDVPPLKILQEGLVRGELKPLSPLSTWWCILGMCIFNIQAEEIVARLGRKKFHLGAPALAERKQQVIELILSGIAKSARLAKHVKEFS